MAEQPAVLERLLRESAETILAARAEIAERRPRFGVLAARGSSDNAARYAQHLFGRRWAEAARRRRPRRRLRDRVRGRAEALRADRDGGRAVFHRGLPARPDRDP